MNSSRIASIVGLVGLLGASGYGSQVAAQAGLAIGGQRANFGVRTLAPGFVPDPVCVPIVSGGSIDARALNLGPGCVGNVTRQPDFILRLSGTSSNLRVYVRVPGARAVSATDTTLLVNTANGGWRCNDDSWGGANPTVDLPSAGAGQYDIWVGSYRAGTTARGQLCITELGSNHP